LGDNEIRNNAQSDGSEIWFRVAQYTILYTVHTELLAQKNSEFNLGHVPITFLSYPTIPLSVLSTFLQNKGKVSYIILGFGIYLYINYRIVK